MSLNPSLQNGGVPRTCLLAGWANFKQALVDHDQARLMLGAELRHALAGCSEGEPPRPACVCLCAIARVCGLCQ